MTAMDAGEEKDLPLAMDVHPRTKRDVMAAHARTAFATRTHFAASTPGMKPASHSAPIAVEDAVETEKKAVDLPMDAHPPMPRAAMVAAVNPAYATQIPIAAITLGTTCA